MGGVAVTNKPICKKCGNPIDQKTVDFFHKIAARLEKPLGRNPSVCGGCLVIALDNLSIECTGEPLFPENWKTVRPEGEPE